MPTSVRLDAETKILLERLAKRSGRSKSDVLREALHRLAEESADSAENDSLYAQISDLVGVASGASVAGGRQHKRAYRDVLAQKHRR